MAQQEVQVKKLKDLLVLNNFEVTTDKGFGLSAFISGKTKKSFKFEFNIFPFSLDKFIKEVREFNIDYHAVMCWQQQREKIYSLVEIIADITEFKNLLENIIALCLDNDYDICLKSILSKEFQVLYDKVIKLLVEYVMDSKYTSNCFPEYPAVQIHKDNYVELLYDNDNAMLILVDWGGVQYNISVLNIQELIKLIP